MINILFASIHILIAARGHGRGLVLLGLFGDQGVAGQQQCGDAGGVLQCGAGDLRGIDHAGLDHVFVDVGRGVIAHCAFHFGHFFADYAAVLAGVAGDLRQRCAAGSQHDLVADFLVLARVLRA